MLPAVAQVRALEPLRTGGQPGSFVFLLYEALCSPSWPRRAPRGSHPHGAGGRRTWQGAITGWPHGLTQEALTFSFLLSGA